MQSIHHRYVLRPIIVFAVLASMSLAQIPDHPIITEVFNNATGINDGPVGRDPTNLHQEFIEIYLPTAANLNPSLNKDELLLTFYEIEGDSGNTYRGHVNQRFDLPTLDLDRNSGGVTPGAVDVTDIRILVLGWVDYNSSDPFVVPNDLGGMDAAHRLGLINGGITTSPAGAVFVAMNGAQFSGTTNFPVPSAESLIDVQADPGDEQVDGVMHDGSNVYLLVNRAPGSGYVQLQDSDYGPPSDADLDGGTILGLSSLLDGIAGNDDLKFSVTAQPYVPGLSVDLEDVLPSGGVFSNWVAQIAEGSGGGYARRFVNQLRTTEDGVAGNEVPALDAQTSYREINRSGPFYPTPGSAVFTTSPPELGVAEAARHTFNVLAGTTGRPGLISANLGGNYPINITATPGASSDPTVATFSSSADAIGILGQSEAFPQIAVTVPASAAGGAIASAPVTITATNSVGGDPSVVNPMQGSGTTITVLKPTTGLDASVPPLPFQTTVFLAVQGFGADLAVPNEFRPSSLGTFVNAQLGNKVQAALNHIGTLLNPATNLEDNTTMDPLKVVFPAKKCVGGANVGLPCGSDADCPGGTCTDDTAYINAAGAPEDLATTVRTSAKVVSGSSAYAAALNAGQTAVRAIQIAIPETLTKGGTFSASEVLFFANSTGDVFNERSGLSRVTTSRTFELAILDTNMTADPISPIESGDADDFGLIVQVGQVRPSASVVSGQLVFLSYMGGVEGEDIDTLDLPGTNATVAILLDLDNLDDVLGCQTITKLFVIDSGGVGTLNVVEALSLNVFGAVGCQPANCDDGNPCTNDSCVSGVCQHINNTNACSDGNPCTTNDACSGGACVGGPPSATEFVCNDGVDNDCDLLTDCADSNCTQSFACAGPNCGNGTCDPPETTCNCPTDCAPPGPPPAPAADPSGINKSRFISLVPGNAGQCTAIRVTLSSLHHVVPPYTAGASVPFTAFEGQVRWAGPATQYVESVSSGVSFVASSLICTPYYQDWSTIGLLHVTGSVIVPSSVYQVAMLGAVCQGTESSCSAVSNSLQLQTNRWGDVVAAFQLPTPPATQPDFGDIGALVNKFKSAIGAPIKARAMLAGGNSTGLINITPDVGFTHISACVDAFRGLAYPYTVADCP